MMAKSEEGLFIWTVRAGLLFPAAIYLSAVIGFWAGVSISSLHLFFSALVVCALIYYWAKESECNDASIVAIKSTILVVLYLGCVVYLQSLIPDGSYDGQQYHAEGIVQLSFGFNPVREMIIPNTWEVSYRGVWLNTLANFSWVVESTIYKITNNISSTKVLPVYYMLFAGMYAFALANHFTSKAWSIFLGVGVSFNPVVIAQMFTNYIDAIAYLTLILAFLSIAEFLIRKDQKIFLQASLFTLIALSVKLTSLIPLAIIWILAFIGYRNIRRNIFQLRYFFPLVVLSVLIFYAPYVTNILYYGNPLYPLHDVPVLGTKADFPQNFVPAGLFSMLYEFNYAPYQEMSRPVAFMMSLFSASYNGSEMSQLRVPFIFDFSEFKVFLKSDVRVSGFGPLFSGAIILSFIGLLLVDYKNKYARFFVLVGIALFITAMFSPQGWWARYVGYVWVVPLLFLLALVISRTGYKILKHGVAWVVIINISGILFVQVREAIASHRYYYNAFIPMLKRENLEGRPWVTGCDFYSVMLRFQENDINYVCERTSPAIIEVVSRSQGPDSKSLMERAYVPRVHSYCSLFFSTQPELCRKFFGDELELKRNLKEKEMMRLGEMFGEKLEYHRRYMW